MKGQKAIGCTLCAITCFLLVAAISNTEWAKSEGWRTGLFLQCMDKGAATPFPFHLPIEAAANVHPFNESSCHGRLKLVTGEDGAVTLDKDDEGNYVEYMPGYMKTTLALLIVGLLIDILGTVLTAMSLKGEDWDKNQKYTLYAIVLFALAMVLLLVSAIVFGVNFTADQQAVNIKYDGCKADAGGQGKVCEGDVITEEMKSRAGEPRTFYFGFCFGVVCLSVVFLIIGIVLLILDHFNPDPKEEEEGQEMKAA